MGLIDLRPRTSKPYACACRGITVFTFAGVYFEVNGLSYDRWMCAKCKAIQLVPRVISGLDYEGGSIGPMLTSQHVPEEWIAIGQIGGTDVEGTVVSETKPTNPLGNSGQLWSPTTLSCCFVGCATCYQLWTGQCSGVHPKDDVSVTSPGKPYNGKPPDGYRNDQDELGDPKSPYGRI